jgi:hypothetical protein
MAVAVIGVLLSNYNRVWIEASDMLGCTAIKGTSNVIFQVYQPEMRLQAPHHRFFRFDGIPTLILQEKKDINGREAIC